MSCTACNFMKTRTLNKNKLFQKMAFGNNFEPNIYIVAVQKKLISIKFDLLTAQSCSSSSSDIDCPDACKAALITPLNSVLLRHPLLSTSSLSNSCFQVSSVTFLCAMINLARFFRVAMQIYKCGMKLLPYVHNRRILWDWNWIFINMLLSNVGKWLLPMLIGWKSATKAWHSCD